MKQYSSCFEEEDLNWGSQLVEIRHSRNEEFILEQRVERGKEAEVPGSTSKPVFSATVNRSTSEQTEGLGLGSHGDREDQSTFSALTWPSR